MDEYVLDILGESFDVTGKVLAEIDGIFPQGFERILGPVPKRLLSGALRKDARLVIRMILERLE
jgi:hypothetical protein